MSDRISAHRLGTVSTGHGRRQSYAHIPLPRMSNSLVLPGTSDPASLVSDVKRGLFCAELGGGEVNPATGDFVFGVSEGYLIENGQLGARVRGANIIGNGPQGARRRRRCGNRLRAETRHVRQGRPVGPRRLRHADLPHRQASPIGGVA